MKKLIFVFAVLLVLVVVAGCNARRNGSNTIKFNPKIEGVTEETSTVVTPTEEPATKKPLAIQAAAPSKLPSSGPDVAILLAASALGSLGFWGVRKVIKNI